MLPRVHLPSRLRSVRPEPRTYIYSDAPRPQLFQNDENQQQLPPDRPSPEPVPETPQTIPETHSTQDASGPMVETTFRKSMQCPGK